MPTDKRRVLWVVESKYGGQWTATCRVWYTRQAALVSAANHQHYYPDAVCRVRAYVPRKEEQR